MDLTPDLRPIVEKYSQKATCVPFGQVGAVIAEAVRETRALDVGLFKKFADTGLAVPSASAAGSPTVVKTKTPRRRNRSRSHATSAGDIENKILTYCVNGRAKADIMKHLGAKTKTQVSRATGALTTLRNGNRLMTTGEKRLMVYKTNLSNQTSISN